MLLELERELLLEGFERSGGVVGGIWKEAGIWICVDGVSGWMVAVLYGVHVHVYRVGCGRSRQG